MPAVGVQQATASKFLRQCDDGRHLVSGDLKLGIGSPLASLKKGGIRLKVLLIKGDLGDLMPRV
jgi:hypothetical protein